MIVPDEKSNETPVDHTSTNIDKENIDLTDENPSKFVNLSDHSMKKVEKIEYGYFVANIETLFGTFLIPVLWQIYSDRNENIGRSHCTTILGSKTSKVQLSSEDEYLAFSPTHHHINNTLPKHSNTQSHSNTHQTQ
ncbi:hypothetical protein BLOT_013228 [Blomia tropicalis]|nr:hypothetical protein BLOT_013228 [Blomia tropicalis]